jgi:cell division protease FtsH
MSDRVGPMAWSSQQHVFLGEDIMTSGREYSDDTAKLVDEEVARILTDQEQRATELLSKHRRGLALVAEALVEHETIDGREVARLIQQGLTESGDTEQVKLNISVVDDINDDVPVEAAPEPAPARSSLRDTPKIVPRPAAGGA